ncbi:MAG: hypothetical protein PHD56_00640 [Anaerostipes sp.]|nr:hypothetical protein [Anaerostipes sp.]
MKKITVFIAAILFSMGILSAGHVVKAEEKTDVPEISVTNVSSTYTFTSKSQGKWIPLKPKTSGILYSLGNIYDKDKKLVPGIKNIDEQDTYIKNVSTADVYYIKLPTQISGKVTVSEIKMLQDNRTWLNVKDKCWQSGKNQNVYQRFNVGKRSIQTFTAWCVDDSAGNIRVQIQMLKNNKWVNVTNGKYLRADEFDTLTTGLKKGSYRLVSKASDKQIGKYELKNSSMSSKYQTKKSKAQKISLGKSKTNIYTSTEKASRWYRVSRTSLKKRYVKVNVANNSGKIKVSVYKKGRTKALKSVTLSSDNSGKIKYTYRLKSGKGTYYVKVSKSGSKMNGKYTIQYK